MALEAQGLSENGEIDMLTTQQLDTILNNQEFNDCLAEAAPYRVKIMKDLSPQMKEVQDTYLKLMIESGHNNIKSIMDKLKLDKKDETAKDEYAKWRKKVMNLFRATLKTIHPNENQVPSIGMLYAAGSLLEYIGRDDLITGNENYDANSPLKFKKLEDLNTYFDNDDIRARMKQIFQDADEVQGELCENADKIKKDIYEKLPVAVRYDKDMNKHGLKQNHFGALVKHKAMGMIKDKETFTKYISNQVDNTNNNIDREEIVLGKTKQF